MKSKFYWAAASLLLAGGTVLAQGNPQSSPPQPQQGAARANAADQRFVTEAHDAGMAEVAHSQLAVQRATNQEVKTFAQRMVDEHSKANQELMQLASTKGITLTVPKTMSPANDPTKQAAMTTEQMSLKGKPREALDRLMKLTGAEFDREYMRHQIMDHDKAIALFEREANNGTDAEIKAWAAKTLPTLREHSQQARDVGAKVGVDTKTSTSNTPRPKN